MSTLSQVVFVTLLVAQIAISPSIWAQVTPVSVNGVVTNGLGAPAFSNSDVTTGAGCGSGTTTTWTYQIVALDSANGNSTPSSQGFTSNKCVSWTNLSSINYLIVTTHAVAGATSCDIYRINPSPGKVQNVPCGAKFYDIGGTAPDGASPPSNDSSGSVKAAGIVTAQAFNASGSGAGAEILSNGNALSACGSQPCIASGGQFFFQAPQTITTSWGMTMPSAAPTTQPGALMISTATGTSFKTSIAAVSTLTNSSWTPPGSPPQLATASGSFSDGNFARITKSSGNVDFVDAGISATSQNANAVLAGPSSGSASSPTFRSLVVADMPTVPFVSTTYGTQANSVAFPAANKLKLIGIETLAAVNTSTLTFYLATVDNNSGAGHRYDIGLYDTTGALKIHLGGLTFGVNGSALGTGVGITQGVSWSASAILPPGRYYLAMTTDCSASCAAVGGGPNGIGTQFSFCSTADAGVTTSGGDLPSSITPPSDSWVAPIIPAVVLR